MMTATCRALLIVVLLFAVVPESEAQVFSRDAFQRVAAEQQLNGIPQAPIYRRGRRPLKSAWPLIIGGSIGCAFGAWMASSFYEGGGFPLAGTAKACTVGGLLGAGIGYGVGTR
jgi:hypothetical protein